MRYHSVDILRTVAIVVMVLVHFSENLSGIILPITGLGAPLFIFLSGLSYHFWLSGRIKRNTPDEIISKVTIRRGLFLFGVGFAFNILVWLPEDTFNWDVLTFIGFALLILNVMRHQQAIISIAVGVVVIVISPALRAIAEYPEYWISGYYEGDLTLSDLFVGFLVTGYFPVFPWIAYSLFGFAVGSIFFPVYEGSKEKSVLPLAILGFLMISLSVVTSLFQSSFHETIGKHVFTGWRMFPPSGQYLLATIGNAFLLFSLLYHYIDRNSFVMENRKSLRIFQTFSQYSFTIYLVHHVVHLWPLWGYGLFLGAETTEYWQKAIPFAISLPLGGVFLLICYLVLSRLDSEKNYGIEGWMRWLCD